MTSADFDATGTSRFGPIFPRQPSRELARKLSCALESVLKENHDQTEIQRRLHDFRSRRDVRLPPADSSSLRAGRSAEAIAHRGQYPSLYRRRPVAPGIHPFVG